MLGFLYPKSDNSTVWTVPDRTSLVAKAEAAAALPVPTEPIADPEAKVKTLKSAADHYEFIQKRLTGMERSRASPKVVLCLRSPFPTGQP